MSLSPDKFWWFEYNKLVIKKYDENAPKIKEEDKQYKYINITHSGLDGFRECVFTPEEFSRITVGELCLLAIVKSYGKTMHFIDVIPVIKDDDGITVLFKTRDDIFGTFVEPAQERYDELYNFIKTERRREFIDEILKDL